MKNRKMRIVERHALVWAMGGLVAETGGCWRRRVKMLVGKVDHTMATGWIVPPCDVIRRRRE